MCWSRAVKVTSTPPSPSTDVDDLEEMEEGDAVEEEEEEVEEEEEDQVDEAEEEEEVDEAEEEVGEKLAVKEPEEYDYPIDSGPYQASDYLDSFYYEKGRKPSPASPLARGDSCECPASRVH